MDLIEMMYPHSGIPKLASKVEGELHICMYMRMLPKVVVQLQIFTVY